MSSSHHSLTGILSYKLGASLNTAPSFFFVFMMFYHLIITFQGLDQLRSGFLQQKSFMQSPQPLHHLQFLTPQQQQLLLQAQQNMTSSPGEMDSRRLRMLLSSRNIVPGRDGQSNAYTEVIPSVGPSLQNMCSPVQRMETDMLMKVSFTCMFYYIHAFIYLRGYIGCK